ncbi:hypothetical protein CHS0354_000811 [Potamilus streckersoni]|uniref:3-isopropylmalate dehydratase n=1 Tax=Potamilus streckersoni TaxID=2493646 RepID=A0AAE0T7B2_9BIVA|nr:hypothetical protein CHS0354_000811 [Potamilus streckersoni]
MQKTLFDKIWDQHVVEHISNDTCILYIDKHFIHEVTSPQAFAGLDKRGINVFRPDRTIATADHNVPSIEQSKTISNELSRKQVEELVKNTAKHHVNLYGLNHPFQGIVHVIGPELGITQPGMTIVCGDSHTSTHGAFGCIAFGIGTSEVEMVLSTQCLLQQKPKKMRINIDGSLPSHVVSKDIILYILSKLSTSGATGYFIEYAGSAIEKLSMEARMTICNMSIELGARGGMIAVDETTFNYIKGREFSPKGKDLAQHLEICSQYYSDIKSVFDKEYDFTTSDISPMITYGTNPGSGIKISDPIPYLSSIPEMERLGFKKALDYMGFEAGQTLLGHPIDYIFMGSCTNGRIEDLRAFASIVKGRKKASKITAYIVPGSMQVLKQARAEGIDKILNEANFELREPSCSACLGMNDDKVPKGKLAISTSNRNFEGRQGPGARTMLASPLTVAASAITGCLTDPREFL